MVNDNLSLSRRSSLLIDTIQLRRITFQFTSHVCIYSHSFNNQSIARRR